MSSDMLGKCCRLYQEDMEEKFCKKSIQLWVGVAVLPRGYLAMSEDTADCHIKEDMPLTPNGQRPWVLLNRIIWSQISAALR